MTKELVSVYVAGPLIGHQKIGAAKNVMRRIVYLRTGNPVHIDLAFSLEMEKARAFAVERYAHSLVGEHSVRGEWFDITQEAAIAAVKAASEAVLVGKKATRIPGSGPGRPKINEEQMPARLPEGTLARIDAVLADKESRAGFLRLAVERELKRRERAFK